MVSDVSKVSMVTLTVSVVCGTTSICTGVWASHNGVVNQNSVPEVSGTTRLTEIQEDIH